MSFKMLYLIKKPAKGGIPAIENITKENMNFIKLLLFKMLLKFVKNLVCFLTTSKKNHIIIELKL